MGKWKPKAKKESNLISVGAVWEAKTAGNYTGKFDRELDAFITLVTENDPATLRLMVFENTFKKTERDPAFKVYATISDPQGGGFKPKKKAIVEEETEEEVEEEEAPKAKKPAKKKLPWEDSEEEEAEEE